jgi:hypothetical protein
MHAFRAGTRSIQNGGWNLDEADNQRIDLRTAWPGAGVYINRAHSGAGDAARAFLGHAIGLADGRGPAHDTIAICRNRSLGLKKQEGKAGVHRTHDAGGVPPTPMLDEEGKQRQDPDGKLMFNPPVKQQRDKKGHPLFDAKGQPLMQTKDNLGYDENGKKLHPLKE